MAEATLSRRATDSPSKQLKDLAKTAVFWSAAVVAFGTIWAVLTGAATKYVRSTDALATVPELKADMEEMKKWRDKLDDRLYTMEWWMEGVGTKMGVPAPPDPASRRRRRARETAQRPD